jgi:hypothetical protein
MDDRSVSINSDKEHKVNLILYSYMMLMIRSNKDVRNACLTIKDVNIIETRQI